MASIIKLSNNKEYVPVVNGWNKTDTELSLTVIATEESIENVEKEFTGNDVIELVDAEQKTVAKGYTEVTSIGIEHGYVIGGVDEEGEDITADVWHIVCARPSLYDMVVENAEKTETISEQLEATQEAVDMLLMG